MRARLLFAVLLAVFLTPALYAQQGDVKYTPPSGGSGGNAATATALAANGANCAAGQYPLGVDEFGAVESCTVDGGGASGLEVGVSTITSGTSTRVPFNDAGVYGEDAGLAFNKTTDTLTAATFVGALTGNSSTSTALAANGANCAAGSYPLGVNASGAVESCTADAGSGGLTIGTSTIASGTTTRVLYDDAGVVGEYVVSGTGSVAMSTSAALTTPTVTGLNTASTQTLGSGVGTATFTGMLCLLHTSAATVGTTEETLATCSLPANAFSANNKGVRISALYLAAANANSKVSTITFGATTIGTHNHTVSGGFHRLDVLVVRTGASTQKGIGNAYGIPATAGNSKGTTTLSTPAETDTGAITISFKATTSAAGGDLTFVLGTVEYIH